MVATWEGMPTSTCISYERVLSSRCFVISHFVETQHTFAMHLDTGRVWDYVGGMCDVWVCVMSGWV